MYSLTYMCKCASQYPDTLWYSFFCLTLLFTECTWYYLHSLIFVMVHTMAQNMAFIGSILYAIKKDIPGYYYLLEYFININSIKLMIFFFALLFLSITGKEISKPPKIIVNFCTFHLQNLLATAHVF